MCRFKSCHPHQKESRVSGFFFLYFSLFYLSEILDKFRKGALLRKALNYVLNRILKKLTRVQSHTQFFKNIFSVVLSQKI